jgi:hypothetical protein
MCRQTALMVLLTASKTPPPLLGITAGRKISATSKWIIQGVPELADQIETVYSLMVMKVKNV